MRYIDSWLSGLGLEYIIPKLKANGITTPKKLAMLTLRDMYEVGKLTGAWFQQDRVMFEFLFQYYVTKYHRNLQLFIDEDVCIQQEY